MRRFAFVFFLIMLFFTTTHPAFGNIVAFSNPINLSNSPSLLTFGTDITASGNNVYAVWVDSTVGGGDIFFRRSIDGGATFSSTINLSNDVGSSLFPHVVASGNSVYVIWSNGSEGSEEIFFRRSIDGGATFSSTINLSNIAGSSTSSSLAVSGNVYAVWEDNTGLTGSNSDIFYKRSTDGGANFENPVKNLSNSPTNSSVDPLIIASGTNVYVLWNDGVTADADDIFFARSTDSGANFSSPANLSNNSQSS